MTWTISAVAHNDCYPLQSMYFTYIIIYYMYTPEDQGVTLKRFLNKIKKKKKAMHDTFLSPYDIICSELNNVLS